jgi:hypothetical protein
MRWPDDHAERGDRHDPVRGGAVRAMTAPAARILSGNAAPAFLAAYPDNATTARLEAGNAPGAKERNLTKDG